MNGIIAFSYLLAAAATVFASYKVIQRYQNALKRLMMSGIDDENISEVKSKSIFKQVSLKLVSGQNEPSPKAKSVEKRKLQTFTFYLIAYLVYVFVYAVLDLINTGNSLSYPRIMFSALIISPALGIIYSQIFIFDHIKEMKTLLKIYAITIFILTILQYFFSITTPSAYEGIMIFSIYNLIPIILIFLLRIKKIKEVSLTVLLFAFISMLVSLLIINFLSKNNNILSVLTNLLYNLNFRGQNYRWLFFIIVILIGWGLAWQLIKGLNYLYINHQITKHQLFADEFLLIFGIYHTSISASAGNSAYLIYLVAFLAYKFVSIFLFRMNKENLEKSTKLLYLRVFDLGEKTENLFKAIETEWRFAGPTQLITGPDLAHTTVEPHEIISYLSGNLKESFSTNNDQVEKNLQNIYLKPLFDSSYQTNEMFCDAVHWKNVLTGLVKKTDVVLMDLRSFDKKYAGCIFEIKQLCYLFDLKKCVFVVDKSTNYAYLEETFKACFTALPTDSPNAIGGDVSVNLFELDTLENEKAKGLFRNLVGLG